MAYVSCFLAQSTSDYCIIAKGSQLIVFSKSVSMYFSTCQDH
ncbi:hypothetical protein BAE44_0020137 [Dichanthelium oligosanthes]|uniref:Uncharacterized protein n=1 Tax=Dichanthelium oligosanthes TaxID=888268 RepID=A0A1E5V154_9POAL|nr:hypothetical protein BAE44_0020137 [Dichanthelium oligosanthes]